jgi:hypothetical protein
MCRGVRRDGVPSPWTCIVCSGYTELILFVPRYPHHTAAFLAAFSCAQTHVMNPGIEYKSYLEFKLLFEITYLVRLVIFIDVFIYLFIYF